MPKMEKPDFRIKGVSGKFDAEYLDLRFKHSVEIGKTQQKDAKYIDTRWQEITLPNGELRWLLVQLIDRKPIVKNNLKTKKANQ